MANVQLMRLDRDVYGLIYIQLDDVINAENGYTFRIPPEKRYITYECILSLLCVAELKRDVSYLAKPGIFPNIVRE